MPQASPASEPVDFSALDEQLRGAKADISASEAHGLMCGVLCVPSEEEVNWLGEIFAADAEDEPASNDARHLLLTLARESRVLLAGEEYEFYPMLPADEFPLASRSQALAQWCTGFMFGLTLAGAGDLEKLPEESRDIVTDLANFATIRAGVADEEEEQAYAELVEYVRVGVMLINQELRGWNPPTTAPNRLH